ncbi:MAG: TRAP transporter large permease [Betaproteobacteria bacterium]|nr:TRAP transporter large permease [Betaproteobacteria bacterium]
MVWYVTLTLMMALFMALLAIGLPVAFAFFTVNIVGALIFLGGEAGLGQLVRNASDAVINISLAPIPLFILMGELMYHTGLAGRAIDAVDKLIARLPGRLSLVAVVSGTIFSALSGSTIANTAMLGSTLIPEMYRRGYHPHMAMGPILGTGGIAMLIPPSALGVLLASLGQIPVAELLIASILPGIVMAGLFFVYILVRCALNPELAPAYDVGNLTLWQRLRPFVVHVLPLLLIFIVVVGSMLRGIASPTESAALGCSATVIAAVLYRSAGWKGISKALIETAKLSVMILFIICASITFSQILAFSNATEGMMTLLDVKTMSPLTLIIAMMVILLILGCFMDQVSMMLITLPFFMPIVNALGINPVWFGVMMMIALEIGFTTPPFGLLLFVMKGVVPEETSMATICAAAVPFIGLMLLTLVLVMMFPWMALWLPGMIVK